MKQADKIIGLLVVGFVILFVSAWVFMIFFAPHQAMEPAATFAPKNLINHSTSP